MKGFYIEITNNLLDPKHRKKMGTSVWEFMWCLDKITKIDEDQVGYVLGGKPIKLREIKEDIGITEPKISKNINKLADQGYLELTRTPYGLIIKVNKAKKRFNQKGKSEKQRDLTKRENHTTKRENLIKTRQKTNNNTICEKSHSPHKKFINFFYEETKNIRGIKPIITGKDGKNLKRVLDLKILSSSELEQLSVYFLMNFRKFSPSISTFLSAGVLNGLMDRLKNDPEFWKSIDSYGNDFVDKLEKLKFEMFGSQERTNIQEGVSQEERALKR